MEAHQMFGILGWFCLILQLSREDEYYVLLIIFLVQIKMAMWNRTNIIVTMIMVIGQINMGLVTLSYKYLAGTGSKLRVIVAYRMLLASLFYPPAIYLSERYTKKSTHNETRTPTPALSWPVIGLAFICGLFGIVVSYNLSLVALELSSATSVTAISNLFPAVTFIIAIIFRQESLNLNTWAGRAKVLGTLIALAGAMILSFYKGIVIEHGSRKFEQATTVFPYPKGHAPHAQKHHEFFGILAAFGSCITAAASIVSEDKLLQIYPNYPRVTGLIVAMGAVQCVVYAAIMDPKAYYWRFDFTIKGVMILYMAIIASGLLMALTTWCIAKKGSFFISVFSPITLVMVAVVSPMVLDEPLYVGSLIGAVVIFFGIYLVIWGKKEDNKDNAESEYETV